MCLPLSGLLSETWSLIGSVSSQRTERSLGRDFIDIAESKNGRMFVDAVDAVAVGITRVVVVPVTKDVVIAARPSEFRQHIVSRRRRERLENALFVPFDEVP